MRTPISEQKKKKQLARVKAGVITVAQVCQEMGVSRSTFYRWKANYADKDHDGNTRATKMTSDYKVRTKAAIKISELLVKRGWRNEHFTYFKGVRRSSLDIDPNQQLVLCAPNFKFWQYRVPLVELLPVGSIIKFNRSILDIPLEMPSWTKWLTAPFSSLVLWSIYRRNNVKLEMQDLWRSSDGKEKSAIEVKNFDTDSSYVVERFYVEDLTRMGVALRGSSDDQLYFFRPTIFCFVDEVELLR
jgi:transposase-like protein